ncbi:aldo/keto reductase [Haloglycomyces albus]|uniref:aldo/keto reductase n=1 Tax=Haloglycomyces albus TaxID=526067 RepID=UPI00046D68E2|nr:aldo/keto reductase [Haloglycomyces albus]
MQRLYVGNSDIEVSRMCLGAMNLGTVQDRDTSFAILDRYVELGGTFIDTANCYCFWVEGNHGNVSERLLGEWMASRQNRDQVVLGTKVGYRPATEDDTTINNPEHLTARRIEASLNESLERLGTDYVDVYWSHRDDRDTDLAETVGGFDRAVSAGKARAIGAGNNRAWRVERARSVAEQDGRHHTYGLMQNRYSYVQPRPQSRLKSVAHVHATETDVDYVRNTPGMAMLTYSSLLSGAYTNPNKSLEGVYDHPGTDARLAVLDSVAHERGVTRNQVVLAWLCAHDAPLIPLVGVSSVEQLDEVVAGVNLRLEPEEFERLSNAA